MGAHSEQAHPQCLGPDQADPEQIQEDIDHQEVVEKGESTSDFPFFNDRRKNLPFNERNVECLPAEKAYYIPFPFFSSKGN